MSKWIILVVICSLSCGCASFNPYDQVPFRPSPSRPDTVEGRHGRPIPILDGAGQILGIPNKLVLWDKRADSHHVSAETESVLVDYLMRNELQDVLVRVNQYDPIGEWRRMAANDRIRPFWRLTVGNYNWLKYTLLPGRLLGGDWYNPYTDTLHLYSDIPSLAVSEAAYAYDIRTRLNPGAYAAIKEIPVLGMSHETTAAKHAIEYYERHLPSDLSEARRILAPNYGADWGGQIFSFLPYGTFVGRLIGSWIGRVANAFR